MFLYIFKVPPDISDEESSRDITVKEGENTSLYCNGRGHPIPRILWRREDGGPIILVNSPTNVTKGLKNNLNFFYNLNKI